MNGDIGPNPPARCVRADERHRTRLCHGDEVVEDLIRDGFIERAVVAVGLQVQLERLQFVANLVWHVR